MPKTASSIFCSIFNLIFSSPPAFALSSLLPPSLSASHSFLPSFPLPILSFMGPQVACQSAESQEQVETILAENDALRTNLAALEQVPGSAFWAKGSGSVEVMKLKAVTIHFYKGEGYVYYIYSIREAKWPATIRVWRIPVLFIAFTFLPSSSILCVCEMCMDYQHFLLR